MGPAGLPLLARAAVVLQMAASLTATTEAPTTPRSPRMPDMIALEGYPVETHVVVTEDGYLLELHRITGSPRSPQRPGKVPVLLQHGLLSSSEDWVVSGPDSALGYALADEGFDVWLGNTRGNTYSNKHVSLSYRSREFWKFSLDEQAVHDLPSMIDYILAVTAYDSLYYVGHASGNALFYMMVSSRPEYNAKIRLQFSLSPMVFLRKLMSLEEAVSSAVIGPLESLVDRVSSSTLLSSAKVWLDRLTMLCKIGIWKWDVCASVLLPIARKVENPLDGINSFSMDSFLHFLQMMYSGVLSQYDHGPLGNLMHYKDKFPPAYDLSRVTCGVVLVASASDILAPLKDMGLLKGNLHNVRDIIPIEDPAFSQRDFLTGSESKALVYDRIIKIMHSAHIPGGIAQSSIELEKSKKLIFSDVHLIFPPGSEPGSETDGDYPTDADCNKTLNCNGSLDYESDVPEYQDIDVSNENINTSDIFSGNPTKYDTENTTMRYFPDKIPGNASSNVTSNEINKTSSGLENNVNGGNPNITANSTRKNVTVSYTTSTRAHVAISNTSNTLLLSTTPSTLKYSVTTSRSTDKSHHLEPLSTNESNVLAGSTPSDSEISHDVNSTKNFTESPATEASKFTNLVVTTSSPKSNGTPAILHTSYVTTENSSDATMHVHNETFAEELVSNNSSNSNSVVGSKLIPVLTTVFVYKIHQICYF